jgi:hypothetical protein
VSNSVEIEIYLQEIIAHLCSKNAELNAMNERLEELLVPEKRRVCQP